MARFLCAFYVLGSYSTLTAADTPDATPPGAAAVAFDPAPSSKVLNRTLFTPPAGMEAGEQIFLTNDMRKPLVGACEKVPAHAAYVEEMLVNIDSIGSPGGKTYQRRVALVVGNGAYEAMRDLENPKNDATSMAKLMHLLGFDVYYAADVKAAALESCLSKFKADLEAKPADVALFYYAGHGVQLTSQPDGTKRNYMLSVDAKVDASGKGYGFKQIDAALDEMRAHAKQSVFLYDACRNSPIGQDVTVVQADGKPVTRQADLDGAAQVEVKSTDSSSAPQLFIAYATSPGKTADDAGPNGSKHSPFTQALLESLPEPGAIFEEALAKAYYRVNELTGGTQTPWTSSSLQKPLTINGAVRIGEAQVRSESYAARSLAAREQGSKWLALAEALKGQPKEWRGRSDRLPFGAAAAALYRASQEKSITFIGHDDEVRDVSYSPDGTRLVTTSSDSTAIIWDAKTGELINRLGEHDDDVSGAAFSPDGRLLVTSSWDGTANIWNATTGEHLKPLVGHRDELNSAAFSPDGSRVVTASNDGTVKIWDTRTGLNVRTINCQGGQVLSAEFSADGTRLVTASLGALKPDPATIKIWNANSGLHVKTIEGMAWNSFLKASFSPDGERVVTASPDANAGVWDLKSAQRLLNLGDHSDTVWSAAFSADGTRIVTASADSTVKLWDAANGKLLKTFEGHGAGVRSAIFSPNGERIASASEDASARVWDATISKPLVVHESGGRGFIRSVAFDPGGTRIVTASDKTAKIWDAFRGLELMTLVGHQGPVNSVAFSLDGSKIVTSSGDATSIVWDIQNKAPIATLTGHRGIIYSAAFSPDGAFVATASMDQTIKTWHVNSGDVDKSILVINDVDGTVWEAAFDPTGQFLASASSDRVARIWDARTEKLHRSLRGHGGEVLGVAFSHDGTRIVTSSHDKTAKVWDPESGKLLMTLRGHGDAVEHAAFSQDDERIITTSIRDGTAKMWDSITGSLLLDIKNLDGPPVSSASFSPDGWRILVGNSDGSASIWSVGSYGQPLLNSSLNLLSAGIRTQIERERVRYWEVDPALLN